MPASPRGPSWNWPAGLSRASGWDSAMFAAMTLATRLAGHLVLRTNRQAPLGDDGSMPTHDRSQRSLQHPVREGAGEPTYA